MSVRLPRVFANVASIINDTSSTCLLLLPILLVVQSFAHQRRLLQVQLRENIVGGLLRARRVSILSFALLVGGRSSLRGH